MEQCITVADSYVIQNDGCPERLAVLFDIIKRRKVRDMIDSGVKCSDDVIAHLLGYDALEFCGEHEVVEETHGIDDVPFVRSSSEYDEEHKESTVSFTIKGRITDHHLFMHDIIRHLRSNMVTKDGLDAFPDEVAPHVTRMHLGGNWVVLFWSDGTVTKLQPHPDDEFDTLAGVIAQVFRKIGHNRVSYSKYDPVSEALLSGGYTSDDLRFISCVLGVTADAMDCDGYDADYKPSDGQE